MQSQIIHLYHNITRGNPVIWQNSSGESIISGLLRIEAAKFPFLSLSPCLRSFGPVWAAPRARPWGPLCTVAPACLILPVLHAIPQVQAFHLSSVNPFLVGGVHSRHTPVRPQLEANTLQYADLTLPVLLKPSPRTPTSLQQATHLIPTSSLWGMLWCYHLRLTGNWRTERYPRSPS